MTKLCKFTAITGALAIALMSAGAALADPTLPDVGRHQHYIVTPNGDRVAIGPDFCDDPNLQDAFNQFHFNVHSSGSALTNGPQGGAPGLNDDEEAEIIATLCP